MYIALVGTNGFELRKEVKSMQVNHVLKYTKTCLYAVPGSPVVKTSSSNAGGVGTTTGLGTKTPHASRAKNRNIKQKQCCFKFNKVFKNGPYQKILSIYIYIYTHTYIYVYAYIYVYKHIKSGTNVCPI